jgi:hypothetical protein
LSDAQQGERAAVLTLTLRRGFLEQGKDFFGVALGFYLFEDVDEPLVGTDEVGGAFHAFDQLAVHVLGLDEVVTVNELHVMVGEEIVRKVVLVLELFLIFDGVAGDPEDNDARLLELLERIAEAAGFDGAAGSVGARIEKENDGFAFEVRERDVFAILILQGKVFYFVAGFHLVSSAVLEMQFIPNTKLPKT